MLASTTVGIQTTSRTSDVNSIAAGVHTGAVAREGSITADITINIFL